MAGTVLGNLRGMSGLMSKHSSRTLVVVCVVGVVQAVDLDASAPAAGVDELVVAHIDGNVSDSVAMPSR